MWPQIYVTTGRERESSARIIHGTKKKKSNRRFGGEGTIHICGQTREGTLTTVRCLRFRTAVGLEKVESRSGTDERRKPEAN